MNSKQDRISQNKSLNHKRDTLFNDIYFCVENYSSLPLSFAPSLVLSILFVARLFAILSKSKHLYALNTDAIHTRHRNKYVKERGVEDLPLTCSLVASRHWILCEMIQLLLQMIIVHTEIIL